METNLLELQHVEKTIDFATDDLTKKLNELQLVFANTGGLAEVSFE